MRIGITTLVEFSMFSSGLANTSVAIAELMKGLGHEATLLNVRGKNAWWDDCTPLKGIFKVVHLEDLPSELHFDILFEICPLSLTSAQRQSLATRSVWVLRKPFVLQEIEQSIYPVSTDGRDLAGISEAWLLRDVTDPDDTTTLETIARVPVRHVPYVWTPLISEVHNRSTGTKTWKGNAANPLFVPIVDTNNTNSSNSTLPLVILREAVRQKTPIRGWRLHNGEAIEKSKFFRENVLKHCSDLDLSGSCVGRQRSIDWVNEENNVALLHLRFRGLRPVLLDLAWVGVPVVHNSPAFKEIGNGADRLYYSDNSVGEAITAFENTISDMKDGVGWFAKDNVRREEILRRWSPVSGYVKALWTAAMEGVSLSPLPERIEQAVVVAPEKPPIPAANTREIINVAFSDMWEKFDPQYNFFLLLLNEAGKHMTPQRTAVGYDGATCTETPDLVVFGPFGSGWRRFGPTVPKVHFTGENTRPVFEPSVELNLGFDHMKLIPYEKYIRFPLWMTYIDWFGADVERLVNPKPMPLSWCTKVTPETLESRKRFCSFVVSNPRNPVRNAAFQWLSDYKPVDSAGRLFTNVDPITSPFAGGGGGELDKVAFYRNYKFCLTYENSEGAGYTTEKFLHAKAAGCVPIYWGDPKVEHDFDMDGAIDARQFKTPEELRAAVEAVDTNDELWKQKAAIPALKEYDVEVARRTLSEVAKRMWGIMGVNTESLPRFLGKSVTESAEVTVPPPVKSAFVPEVPIVTTYVTWKFLGSLQHWLAAVQAQTRALPTLKAHIWNGGDIPEETIASLQEKFSFATFELVPKSTTPPDFDDFWDPTHYAWKLWVYHTMATRPDFKDKMIFYMDAGAVLCKWPMEWMRVAQADGLACLEDPRERNERWCSEAFCSVVNVTDDERAARQIVGGLMYFRSGSELATQFFAEAFRLGQIRKVLVGPRLSGVATDGQSYGHRQDQSVLSILVRRFPVPLLPLDTVYGDHSMRKTASKGQSIYVHRGNFNTHLQPIKGVDDVFVINLERRADRMEKFLATHPELDGVVERRVATDGRQLRLTPEIAKIFASNDFFWKKAVLGCAMSHMGLWWKLVNDHAEIGNYLIFEDDAKMVPGWRDTLEASMEHVPDDYDVLYLGGILPPNRAGFETVLEPVTKYYSRIRPNSFFGQNPASPYFHSCAYAYVLSRRGAAKIFDMMMKKGGFWTSADHIMCGPNSDITAYFLTPLVAGCYQDDDPAYAASEFNNFSRVDKFDSDLWNNDERFSKEDILSQIALSREDATLGNALDVIYGSAPVAHAAVAPAAVAHAAVAPPNLGPIVLAGTKRLPFTFVALKEHNFDFSKLCESNWLFRIMGGITSVSVETVDADSPPPAPGQCPIFILQRPHVLEATKLLHAWSEAGAKFKILHLSDESSKKEHRDPLLAYFLPGCVKVLRFYNRDDFPKEVMSKILVIPLGPREGRGGSVTGATPQLPFRELHWSFFGTDWMNRSKDMKPLMDAKFTNKYKFMGEWNDPAGLSAKDYTEAMLNSMFVPCPVGMNWETFRLYEALECGCVPLVLKTVENEAWFRWISNKIPLLPISSWDDSVRLMMTLMSNQRRIEVYRDELLKGWSKWVEEVCSDVQAWLKE
jgi:alpha(1,3/1,4) fucosyltransferase